VQQKKRDERERLELLRQTAAKSENRLWAPGAPPANNSASEPVAEAKSSAEAAKPSVLSDLNGGDQPNDRK
jgi:hypothetical protein